MSLTAAPVPRYPSCPNAVPPSYVWCMLLPLPSSVDLPQKRTQHPVKYANLAHKLGHQFASTMIFPILFDQLCSIPMFHA